MAATTPARVALATTVLRAGARIAGSTWLRVLAGGSTVYGLVTAAAIDTQNLHLLPVVLLLGAALIPVTFVVCVFERLDVPAAVLPVLAVCCAAGGSLGVAAASVLEYGTLRDLGALPMLAVGLIEETVKLAVPLWLLVRGRFPQRAQGLLLGVAAGMSFAMLETMGYGLVALIQSNGRLGPAEEVLLVRGLLSPIGHAAWTGLVCAALWRAVASPRPIRAWPPVVAAFATAVLLHGLWDSTDSTVARVAIGAVSGTLLALEIRRARRPGARA